MTKTGVAPEGLAFAPEGLAFALERLGFPPESLGFGPERLGFASETLAILVCTGPVPSFGLGKSFAQGIFWAWA